VRPSFSFRGASSPVIATAIHAGHDLRPAIEDRSALDDAARLREEDPFTDRLVDLGGPQVVAHRSRFEVDLNRPRETAVYRVSDDAWGLALWEESPSGEDVELSLRLYDDFYVELSECLDEAAARGPFVVLDLHSYNHRREGANVAPADVGANPEVNVGTGSLDRARWRPIVDRFIEDLGHRVVLDHRLDVRENVRFRGGELSRWVNERYGAQGCALAVEFKKTFMDEWTGAVDERHLDDLRRALAAVVPSLIAELDSLAHA
jgi:N-formylglutamate deformylase